MLLEGGSGPLDSDDFYDSLSKAQREKAREQAECVKMYMHMLDLFSPDLDAHECAVRAAVLTGKYSSTTIQTWFREYCGNNSHFRQDGRGKDSPEWILDQMSGFGDDGEPETSAESDMQLRAIGRAQSRACAAEPPCVCHRSPAVCARVQLRSPPDLPVARS